LKALQIFNLRRFFFELMGIKKRWDLVGSTSFFWS